MIRYGTTCSSRSQNPTPSTQILLTLWLQVMYHRGKTKGSSSMKVISTYGMNHTSSESALTAYSEDVYRWKKASRSSSDATHHHMEDIMVHSAHIRRTGKVDYFGQPCMKIQRTSSGGVEHVRGTGISIKEMPCHSPTTSCMKIRRTSSGGVELVRGTGISIQEMSFHSPTTSRSNSSMSGVSTTWVHFQSQRTMSTSW